MSILGPLVSAGASLYGGMQASKATQQANAANLQFAREQAHEQATLARAGIRMKVHDAKEAGIHPLYALGAPSMGGGAVAFNAIPDTSMGSALHSAGQSVGRAIAATDTPSGRATNVTAASQALLLERGTLENELLRTQIASAKARLSPGQVGPPMPTSTSSSDYAIPGQAQSGLVKSKPLEVAPAAGNAPQQEGGPITDVGFSRTATGWAPLPSKDVKERIEDVAPYEWSHFIRTQFGKPPFTAPVGQIWNWSPMLQEWQLKDYSGTRGRSIYPNIFDKYGRYLERR